MQRVVVAGLCGSGKTTMAAVISERLGIPNYELDALCHGPGGVKRPEFERDVGRFVTDERWVCEDRYHRYLGDLLWEKADTVIWLDLPHRTVLWRVIRRSLWRIITRRKLWNNDQRETWRILLFSPRHPIRCAWSRHHKIHRDTSERIARHPAVTVARLGGAREAKRWVRGLGI